MISPFATVLSILVVFMSLPSLGLAQVLKCVDPTTKAVTFTNEPACPLGASSQIIQKQQTSAEIAAERTQAQEALRAKYTHQRMDAQQELPIQSVQQPSRPQINRYECDLARRNAETAASSTTNRRNNDKYAEREMNIKCFGSDEAARIERSRAAAPKVTINNSDSVLRDQYGNTYRGPAGGTVIRQDGKVCQDLVGTIRC